MEKIKDVKFDHTHRTIQFENENGEWEVLENADHFYHEFIYVLKKPVNEKEASKLFVWHSSGELNRDGEVNTVNIYRLANLNEYFMFNADDVNPFKVIGK